MSCLQTLLFLLLLLSTSCLAAPSYLVQDDISPVKEDFSPAEKVISPVEERVGNPPSATHITDVSNDILRSRVAPLLSCFERKFLELAIKGSDFEYDKTEERKLKVIKEEFGELVLPRNSDEQFFAYLEANLGRVARPKNVIFAYLEGVFGKLATPKFVKAALEKTKTTMERDSGYQKDTPMTYQDVERITELLIEHLGTFVEVLEDLPKIEKAVKRARLQIPLEAAIMQDKLHVLKKILRFPPGGLSREEVFRMALETAAMQDKVHVFKKILCFPPDDLSNDEITDLAVDLAVRASYTHFGQDGFKDEVLDFLLEEEIPKAAVIKNAMDNLNRFGASTASQGRPNMEDFIFRLNQILHENWCYFGVKSYGGEFKICRHRCDQLRHLFRPHFTCPIYWNNLFYF